MSTLSATEVAFLLVACQQAVLSFGWLAGAGLLAASRSAMLHWALHAAMSAIALAFFIGAARPGDEAMRGLANLVLVGAMIALQRGVRVFLHRESAWRWHAVAVVAAAIVTWYGLDPAHGGVRVAVISGTLAVLSLITAWDMQLAARWKLDWRWRLLLSVPVLLAGLVFAARAFKAIVDPAFVVTYMTANSAINIGTALVYMVVGLSFQLTLVGLVVSQFVTELRDASRVDALTGLLNRRALDEALNAEVLRTRRLGETFSVLMIDADHFKDINDRSGHAAGDHALQHLATVLASQMRDIDRVGRYGGEEFVVMLPGTAQLHAKRSAERLRERVESLPFQWEGRSVTLTISIGVAQWQGDLDDVGKLIGRADAALYRAKQSGRNRVITSMLASSAS